MVLVERLALRHRAGVSFGAGTAIGVLGGLIGLGGAEFRLPVLVALGYTPHRAVPLNLVVSAFTLAAALAIRARTLSLAPVVPYALVAVGLLSGALMGAYAGPTLARRLHAIHFARVILVLLLAIGLLLIVEAFLPARDGALVHGAAAHVVSALALGLGIGLVSSLLGVAGGELIIPTLAFVYGVPIKTAGTASVLISLPMVLLGIARWLRTGTVGVRAELPATIAPMAFGSVLGAVLGGLIAAVAPGALLKVLLGGILIVSALRGFGSHARIGRVARPVAEG
uniref:Probable membrane transporter protein n=1 Tax=Thermorudis peleae TaxID=1382356 RepID=A0A831T8I5_9BACT